MWPWALSQHYLSGLTVKKNPSSLPSLHKAKKVVAQTQSSPVGPCIKPGGMNPILTELWAQEGHLHPVTTLFCAAQLL